MTSTPTPQDTSSRTGTFNLTRRAKDLVTVEEVNKGLTNLHGTLVLQTNAAITSVVNRVGADITEANTDIEALNKQFARLTEALSHTQTAYYTLSESMRKAIITQLALRDELERRTVKSRLRRVWDVTVSYVSNPPAPIKPAEDADLTQLRTDRDTFEMRMVETLAPLLDTGAESLAVGGVEGQPTNVYSKKLCPQCIRDVTNVADTMREEQLACPNNNPVTRARVRICTACATRLGEDTIMVVAEWPQ